MSTYIFVRIGEHDYGIDISSVKSIEPIYPSTHMIGAHPSIRGVINLRDHVVPIVDLTIKFGYPATKDTNETRLIIVPGIDSDVGLVVSEANQVVEIERDKIEPPKDGWEQNSCISGVAQVDGKRIGLIDINVIVRPETYNT